VEPTTQTPVEPVANASNPLMKKIDTLMGLSVIGISLAGTLLAVALFANPY
jgi:hypothetical protein